MNCTHVTLKTKLSISEKFSPNSKSAIDIIEEIDPDLFECNECKRKIHKDKLIMVRYTTLYKCINRRECHQIQLSKMSQIQNFAKILPLVK